MNRLGTIGVAALAALAAGCATQRAKPASNTLISHRGESVDAPDETHITKVSFVSIYTTTSPPKLTFAH